MSAPAAEVPLVGRDRELALIDECLDTARRGEGASLMLVGEPGSGKTSLLAEARRRSDGFMVIGCTGVQWEAELPFGGLHELITPLLGHLDALPDPQRRAVDVALGLTEGADGQPLHLLAGVLSLLAEATRVGPVLLVADDLQWIDSATCEALSFVARRLAGEPVAFLVATRPGGDLPGLQTPRLPLAPLTAEAVGQLAEHVLGRPLLHAASAELTKVSSGNPLAVIEGLRHGGDAWQPGALIDGPLPVGDYIERGFASRIAGLSDAARLAVETMAASIDPSVASLWIALDDLGIGHDALAEAEREGIIEFRESEVQFSHPVLRSMAYGQASPGRIRRCHAALTKAVAEGSDLHAWHAACATFEPNETVAHALDVAAEHFAQRGGSIAASQALARAGALTPAPDERAERLFRAGRHAYRAGRSDRAEQLFASALACATEPRLRLKIEVYDVFRGAHYDQGRDTVGELERAVERARDLDPALMVVAATALANETVLRGWAERLGALDALLVESALQPELDAILRVELDVIHGHFGALTATSRQGFEAASDRLRRAADLHDDYGSGESITSLVEALVWIEDHSRASASAARHLAGARRAGDAFVLAGALWSDGYRSFALGEWSEARSRFQEALQTCRAIGNESNAAMLSGLFASLQAAQGDPAWLDSAEEIRAVATRHGTLLIDEYLGAAGGMLELAKGNPEAAVEAFGQAVRWQQRSGHREPVIAWWPTDLVEAQLLVGDLEAAREGTEALRARATVTGQRRLEAMVARLDGLQAGKDAREHFERSLELGVEARDPYGVARTQLAFGRWLRRVRQRAEARAVLSAALATFERLGAVTWAEQARRELEATGLEPHRRSEADPAALTPQEAQVAELVASGASNKEAAGVLFLSPKTIETHLSRIYRKLDVTSRTQLAVRLRASSEGAA